MSHAIHTLRTVNSLMNSCLPRNCRTSIRLLLCISMLLPMSLLPMLPVASASSSEKPHLLLEKTVQAVLDEFVSQRALLEADKNELYALVDHYVVPWFDFEKISKLVLASHWRTANQQQRQAFSKEFKDLLIRTYATALFEYTGNEVITFTGSTITERKGRKFAEVTSEFTLGGSAPPVSVNYALFLDDNEQWKIYNLTISGLNLVTNYRNTYNASIDRLGLDGIIAEMKDINAQNQ